LAARGQQGGVAPEGKGVLEDGKQRLITKLTHPGYRNPEKKQTERSKTYKKKGVSVGQTLAWAGGTPTKGAAISGLGSYHNQVGLK